MRKFLLIVSVIYGCMLMPVLANAAPATVDTSSSALATANSTQRKTFFDTVNDVHWAFYYNGAAIEYSYSVDGENWVSAGTLAYNTSSFSVVYKVISATPYVFVVSEANSYDVVLRRGAISPTAIAFAAEQTVYDGTAAGNRYVAPTVTLNGSDNVWVSALHGTIGFQTVVRRSTNPGDGDLSVWNAASNVGDSVNKQNTAVLVPHSGAEISLLVSTDNNQVVNYRYDGANWSSANVGGDFSWHDFNSTGFNGIVYSIALYGSDIYVGGLFTSVAGNTKAVGVARFDGNSWHELGEGSTELTNVRSLLIVGDDLYIGGQFSNGGNTGSDNIVRWNITDQEWHALDTGLSNTVYAMAALGTDIYIGGFFYHTPTSTGRAIRWDTVAEQFVNLGVGIGGATFVYAVTTVGTDVYFGGSFTQAGGVAAGRLARWNSLTSSWVATASIPNGSVRGLAVSGAVATDLYVVGNFANAGNANGDGIVRVNTTNNAMTSLGTGVAVTGTTINSIAVSGADVYIAGPFVNAGGNAAADYIARWNGAAWSAFAGSGVNGVETIAISGADFYFGGSFVNAGSVAKADYFAKWDGVTWNAYAERDDVFSAFPTTIAAVGDDVFLGGNFSDHAGIAAADNIVRYDGENWHALGAGLNGAVSYIKAIGTDLFIFGSFTNAGGTGSDSIVRWDTLTEQYYGYGAGISAATNPSCVGVVTVGNDIYLGGSFNSSTSGMVRWNAADAQWENPGAGFDNVNGIEKLGTDVYLGGLFETGNGSPFDFLAKWDSISEQWSTVGSGVNSQIYAMNASDSDIYIMGIFTDAGGVANADGVARWDGTNWYGLGSGIETDFLVVPVDASIFRDGNLYISGGFNRAGGLNLPYMARWDGSGWYPVDFEFATDLQPNSFYSLHGLAFAGDNVYRIFHGPRFSAYKPATASDLGDELEISATNDSDGNVYLAYRNDSDEIKFRRFDDDDLAWGDATTLSLTSAEIPSIAFNDSTDTVTVAWSESSSINYSAAQAPYEQSNWSTPVGIYDTGTNSAVTLSQYQVTDDLVIHWTNGAANPYNIYTDFLLMTVAPTVAITSAEVSPTKNDPISVTFTFSANVSGFAIGDVVVANATKSNFVAVDDSEYTLDLTPIADGVITVDVGAAVAKDAFGNDNTAATQFSITYDATAPAMVISSSETSPTNAASIPISIEFDEDVTGFAIGDIVVTNATKSNFVAVDASSYTFDLAPTANGVITVNVAAAIAQDDAGNDNTAASQFSITYDSTIPTVSISDPGAAINLINRSSFAVSGNCSENGRTVAISATSSGGGSSVNASTTCTTSAWSKNLNLSGLGDGLVTIEVEHVDLAGNEANAATRIVVKNIIAPVATISSSTPNPTNANPMTIAIEFNKDVTGFTIGDIEAVNATVGNFSILSARRYQVALTPITDGLIKVDIPAAAAQDGLGNKNLAAVQFVREYREELLPTTICSVWNSFLSGAERPLWNIMEHINSSDRDLEIQSTLYDFDGTERSNVIFTIEKDKQFDLLVHEMEGWTADSYGLICSRVIDGELGDLDGQMVYYKQRSENEFEFAFSSPFVGGLVGKQYIGFNSVQPSLDPSEANNFVANWIQITNLSKATQKGKLKFYDNEGILLKDLVVEIAGRGQKNIAAHEWDTPKMGLVEWIPESSAVRFVVTNTRYLYDNVSLQESFDAAFELQASSGYDEEANVAFDTVNATAIIEIENIKNHSIYLQISYYSLEGSLIKVENYTLAPFASQHVVVNNILDNGIGQANISTNGTGKKNFIATVLQYGRDERGGVSHAYGISVRKPAGDIQRSTYNTYLNQSCELYIFNPGDVAQQLQLNMLRYDGTRILQEDPITLGAKQSIATDLCSNESSEASGVITLEAENYGTLNSYLLRNGAKDSYRIFIPNR